MRRHLRRSRATKRMRLPTTEERVDGKCARTKDRNGHEQNQVREFDRAEQVRQSVNLRSLGGQQRDDHRDDERRGSKSRQKPGEQKSSAEKLRPRDERRVERKNR